MTRGMRRRVTTMGKRPLDHLSKGELLRLLPAVLIGAEGDDDGDKGGDDKGGNSDDKSGDDDDSDADDDADDNKGDDDKDTAGLKSALAKERAAAKTAARELKKLQKEKSDAELAKKSDIEQAQAKEQAATEKVAKLAAGLLRRDLEAAISKAAAASKFIDADDAIAGVDRSSFVYEQDADDPTDITIDYKTVEKAVKALAAKKPHFIAKGTDDGDATGGQFGAGKQKKRTDEEALLERYPALRG